MAHASGRVGKDTREKTMSDTDKTMAILGGSVNDSNLSNQFQAALNGREPTPELMYEILYGASKGYFRQNQNSSTLLLRGRPGRR